MRPVVGGPGTVVPATWRRGVPVARPRMPNIPLITRCATKILQVTGPSVRAALSISVRFTMVDAASRQQLVLRFLLLTGRGAMKWEDDW